MALPHEPRPNGSFRRITDAALDAAIGLTHLEHRVLITLYRMADYQTLVVKPNRAEVARRAGCDRTRAGHAIRTLADAGFLTLTNGGMAQLNPAPSAAQRSSQDAAQRSTSGNPRAAQRSTKCGAAQHGVRRSAAPDAAQRSIAPTSPIRNGREEEQEEKKREEDRSSRVRVCVREGRSETVPEPEQPEPLVYPLDAVRDAIVKWGAGTIGGSAAGRVATVLYDLAEQYPIPDPSGQDASPISVCLAMVDLMRGLGADGPPPTSIARVRGYADAVLRDCAAEGRMPGQLVTIDRVSRLSDFERSRRDLHEFAKTLGGAQ